MQNTLGIPDRRAWRAVRNDGVWLASPLRQQRVSCDRHGFEYPHRAASHAYPSARFRRSRTRPGVENRSFSAGDKTLVRAGQCRHRAGGRMRGARYRRPRRGDRILPDQRRGSCRGRPGNAAGGRHRRRSRQRRHQGVRAEQASLAAGGIQGIYQGALHRIRHSDRRLWPFHPCGRRTGLCPRAGRADRGQG